MTKRDPHPDNELIDRMGELGGGAEGGRSGGQINRDIGTRAELIRASDEPSDTERPRAQDHPEAVNEAKGEKTLDRLSPREDQPSGN